MQQAKAPGWYRDPDDPVFLRYWDGAQWTGPRRERPSWGPALTPEEEAAHRAALRRRRWWLRGSGSLLLMGMLALGLFALRSETPSIPPRTVDDTAFTTAANDLCARSMPAIRSQPPQTGSKEQVDADARTAARVEQTAADLSALVAGLRGLPVAEGDRGEVEAWLAEWDRFIGVGRQYAVDLRNGKHPSARAVGERAAAPSVAIFRFARANGMPECTVS